VAGRSRVWKDIHFHLPPPHSKRGGLWRVEPIPQAERNLGGFDFFLLWAGAAISLAEIWAGSLLVPLGLGLGILANLLGHLIGNTPFALGGIIGADGVPTMVMFVLV
jgi:purine-cytosine permease-like protein